MIITLIPSGIMSTINKKRILRVLLLQIVLLYGCQSTPTRWIEDNERIAIAPDYAGVTVPVNIAPLNFSVGNMDAENICVRFCNKKDTFFVYAPDGDVDIPTLEWKRMLQHTEDSVEVRVLLKQKGRWHSRPPFYLHVSQDSIDPSLVYRLIPPGYELWNKMGIYQRDLTGFEEKPLFENRTSGYNCVNCHSLCQNQSDRFLFHLRGRYGGTVLVCDGQEQILDTKIPESISPFVYPYWHPSGDFIAFSRNKTAQTFHQEQQVEVYDVASDLVIYDIRNNEILTSPNIHSDHSFETFPCFSPDGRSLYYCTAVALEMPTRITDLRYHLCRIDFNPEGRTFGERVDTLFHAIHANKSVSFPRLSPDGRKIMFTVCDFGTFPIWHPEADLRVIDLESGVIDMLEEVNSDQTESYHSWSSSGRWFVFSSRRLDGLYTRPYLCYYDRNGKAGKPFLLPQKKGLTHYDRLMESFNIPEFANDEIKLNPAAIHKKLKNNIRKSPSIRRKE